jgi:hypothetical protein
MLAKKSGRLWSDIKNGVLVQTFIFPRENQWHLGAGQIVHSGSIKKVILQQMKTLKKKIFSR